MMIKRYGLVAIFLVVLTSFMNACGNAVTSNSSSSSSVPSTVTLAYQPSLGATPLVILKHQGTLEKQFPHTTIQWKIVFSGASVRDAIVANQAQIGYLGVPPFLVGWSKGVNWKVLITLTRADIWLVARDSRLKSLKDFTPNDKIGVVAPDALQAIILRKAAQQQLGNAHALDSNLVSIAPADARQALLSGQIAANFASSPFQYQEVAEGGHIVVHSFDVLGKVTSDEVAVPQSFYDQYPDFSKKLYQDLVDATAFATNHQDQTAQYLSQDQIGKGSPDQFKAWLQEPGFAFNTTPNGLLTYATFMQSIGLTSKSPRSVKDLELPVLNGAGS